MARIFYGIMGDSRGHLTRSLSVASELSEHEFLFAGGGVVAELRGNGRDVVELPMVGTVLRDGRVDGLATLYNTACRLAGRRNTIAMLARRMQEFQPDLAITDYEYFTPHAARMIGVQCVSLDNQHMLTRCRYARPPGQWLNMIVTCSCIRLLFSASDRHLVSSFHQPPVIDGTRTECFAPVLPHELDSYTASSGDYGLVYARGVEQKDVQRLLSGRKTRYVVYGLNECPDESNVRYKTTSRQEFLEDLAGCRYVICNGGHSLLCEALHLGKPVFALPTRMFYEQYVNAHFLASLGFGSFAMHRADRAASLNDFEADVDRFAAEIRGHDFRGNERIAARLRELL